ncbi:hypothetical protein CI109_103063 [Kwoniella shandongensis]|uniref:Uncharacterized protein n=1 Tax=Kwoniella shandongensis TaxID=1734106 RepID=A0A5M6C8S2_9TREE|nr:uncharacterized protein CI109_000254 [Kwoniella shandongensis]KAA5531413.1 hypothetical protein CI109_000254 [Kwoniella shandongensis]
MPSSDSRESRLQLVPLPPLPASYLEDLPPIPVITDPKLKKMVFTHTSAIMKPRSYNTSMMLLDGQAGMDYEKLEHVGDALLEAVAVTLAHELYPNVRQGGASAIRDKLVCNVTLAQVSAAYGLHKDLIVDQHMRQVIKANEKVRASLFEAYIAGVYYSLLGPDVVRSRSSSVGSKEDDKNSSEGSSSPTASSKSNNDSSSTDGSDNIHRDNEFPAQVSRKEEHEKKQRKQSCQQPDHATTESSTSSPEEAPNAEASANHFMDDTNASTASDEEESSPEDPATPESSEGSATIKLFETRGEAFDYLFAWLSPVFEPICHFVVDVLRAEEMRIQALPRNPYANFDLPEEWAEEDRKAVGGKATLHQCNMVVSVGIPSYTYETVDIGNVIGAWKVVCVAKDGDGKEWKAEAIRMTKQAASNVAAWKICRQLGLMEDEEQE